MSNMHVRALSVGFAASAPKERDKWGAAELGRCRGKPTWSAGACPRPTKSMFLLSKLLSRIESGDPQWWRFTTWVAGPNCQRPLAAA